jgi:hypothetical protein
MRLTFLDLGAELGKVEVGALGEAEVEDLPGVELFDVEVVDVEVVGGVGVVDVGVLGVEPVVGLELETLATALDLTVEPPPPHAASRTPARRMAMPAVTGRRIFR